MKIINAGFDYKHPKDFKLLRPNGSGDYVLLILRSPAFFVFENKTYHTRGNSVIIYKLGTPQIYGAHETEFINDWIHFELSQDEVQYLQKLEIPFDTLMEFQSVNALSREIKNTTIYGKNQ
jgi:AraC family transcriptional regulator of arabinose operon